MRHGETLDDNLSRARDAIRAAADEGARLVLLPEYFFATFGAPDAAAGPRASAPHAPRIRALLADASRAHGVVVAANLIEERAGALANVGVAYEDGRETMRQEKLHAMPREAAAGVTGGAALHAANLLGRRAGMLVCADILFPEAVQVLALQGADILLNPVMSPWREADEGREARVALYVARAYDARAFVLKAAGHRRPDPSRPGPAIAGRSLVTAPWGVLARARDDFEDELLITDLDHARLAAFRAHQAGFPARRPDAYTGLL